MDLSERKITRGANQTAADAVRNVTSRISSSALRRKIAYMVIMAIGPAMYPTCTALRGSAIAHSLIALIYERISPRMRKNCWCRRLPGRQVLHVLTNDIIRLLPCGQHLKTEDRT